MFAPLVGLIVDRQSTPKEKDHISPSDAIEKAHHKFMMSIEDTTKAVEFIIKCNKDKIYKLNDAVLVTACAAVVFCLLTLVPNLQVQVRYRDDAIRLRVGRVKDGQGVRRETTSGHLFTRRKSPFSQFFVKT